MAVDANGDIYAAQQDGYGIKKITYDTEAVDRSFGINGIYYGEGIVVLMMLGICKFIMDIYMLRQRLKIVFLELI